MWEMSGTYKISPLHFVLLFFKKVALFFYILATGLYVTTGLLVTLRELILARTNFGEFGGLVEFLFQFMLVMWQFAKISSLQKK